MLCSGYVDVSVVIRMGRGGEVGGRIRNVRWVQQLHSNTHKLDIFDRKKNKTNKRGAKKKWGGLASQLLEKL